MQMGPVLKRLVSPVSRPLRVAWSLLRHTLSTGVRQRLSIFELSLALDTSSNWLGLNQIQEVLFLLHRGGARTPSRPILDYEVRRELVLGDLPDRGHVVHRGRVALATRRAARSPTVGHDVGEVDPLVSASLPVRGRVGLGTRHL